MAQGLKPIRNPDIARAFKERVPHHIRYLPPAADADYFMTSTALAAAATTLAAADMTKCYVATMPVVPVVVVTNDQASGDDEWTSVTLQMTGIDQFGDKITETVAGSVSGGVWTCTCTHAYVQLVTLTFTIVQGEGETPDSSDAYTVGFAKTYGLGCKIGKSDDVVIHNFNGATDAGTVSTTRHTYVFAGTPDASKVAEFYVIPDCASW